MEISTVPVVFFRALLEAALRRGCVREGLLADMEVSEEVLAQDRARLPGATYSALVERLTDELQDEYCGLVTQPVKPGTFAMMCYACIHCATLGDFLERSTHFHELFNDNCKIVLGRDDDEARLEFLPLDGVEDPHHLLAMSVLAICHRLMSWLLGQGLVLSAVRFAHPRPEYAAAYNLLFRAPIQFDGDRHCLLFSSSYLDMPVRQSEQALEEFLQMPGARLMGNPDNRNSHAAKVANLIRDEVAAEFPDFEWVAGQLHSTSGTLRRRLRQEGTSYQQLKDDIRRDTAIYNLNRGTMSTEEVAASVGFSEPTSFFRAFKRWTGVTPRAYIVKQG